MTWVAVRDGVKARLDTIAGLSAHDTMPSTLPDRDIAAVLPANPLIEPDGHVGGAFVNFRVFVRCSRGNLKDSQDALDPYLWPTGAKSIVAAVLGAPGLPVSGTNSVHDTRFTGVIAYAGEESGFAVSAEVVFTSRAVPS